MIGEDVVRRGHLDGATPAAPRAVDGYFGISEVMPQRWTKSDHVVGAAHHERLDRRHVIDSSSARWMVTTPEYLP